MTNRQKKINVLLQQDLAEILHLFLRKESVHRLIVSVTAVRVTTDLQIAKVYISVFPFAEANQLLSLLKGRSGEIKNNLAVRIRNQMRVVPNLMFFVDDSLQQIEKIDHSLRNPEHPLKS